MQEAPFNVRVGHLQAVGLDDPVLVDQQYVAQAPEIPGGDDLHRLDVAHRRLASRLGRGHDGWWGAAVVALGRGGGGGAVAVAVAVGLIGGLCYNPADNEVCVS
jgi:hypothetical protein